MSKDKKTTFSKQITLPLYVKEGLNEQAKEQGFGNLKNMIEVLIKRSHQSYLDDKIDELL